MLDTLVQVGGDGGGCGMRRGNFFAFIEPDERDLAGARQFLDGFRFRSFGAGTLEYAADRRLWHAGDARQLALRLDSGGFHCLVEAVSDTHAATIHTRIMAIKVRFVCESLRYSFTY